MWWLIDKRYAGLLCAGITLCGIKVCFDKEYAAINVWILAILFVMSLCLLFYGCWETYSVQQELVNALKRRKKVILTNRFTDDSASVYFNRGNKCYMIGGAMDYGFVDPKAAVNEAKKLIGILTDYTIVE